MPMSKIFKIFIKIMKKKFFFQRMYYFNSFDVKKLNKYVFFHF